MAKHVDESGTPTEADVVAATGAAPDAVVGRGDAPGVEVAPGVEDVREDVAIARPDPGSLTITEHALRRIAGQVALGVPGVAPTSPKVEWQRLGTRARVSLEVTLVWPVSAAQVTREVQDSVARELVRQAAQELDAVSVAVRDVALPPRAAAAPRVR